MGGIQLIIQISVRQCFTALLQFFCTSMPQKVIAPHRINFSMAPEKRVIHLYYYKNSIKPKNSTTQTARHKSAVLHTIGIPRINFTIPRKTLLQNLPKNRNTLYRIVFCHHFPIFRRMASSMKYKVHHITSAANSTTNTIRLIIFDRFIPIHPKARYRPVKAPMATTTVYTSRWISWIALGVIPPCHSYVRHCTTGR